MANYLFNLPLSSDQFTAGVDTPGSHRRTVFKRFPQGGCPLTGILSLIGGEDITNTLHTWYEEEYQLPNATTRGTNPLTSSAPADGDSDTGTANADGAQSVTAVTYLKVSTTKDFRVGLIIQVGPSATQFYITAVVNGVSDPATNGFIKLVPVRAYTQGSSTGQINITEFASGALAQVIGNTFGEGNSGIGINPVAYKKPYAIQNVSQKFETPFQISEEAMAIPTWYDARGTYWKEARDKSVAHLVDLELSTIFGQRSTTQRPSFDTTQGSLNNRTMSGIVEFLTMWDAGSTGITVDGANYAPYAFKAPSTVDTDDNKRVIANASGTMSVNLWNQFAERLSTYRTNRTDERLVLCGGKAMLVFEEMFRQNSTFMVKAGETAYGLKFTTLHTPFGDFHFVVHPLFRIHPTWAYWCLILDVWSLKHRPFVGQDTRRLENVQPKKATYREDVYQTQLTLEALHIRNNMLIQNVQTYVES